MATKIVAPKNTQDVYSFKMLIDGRWRKIATAESWKRGWSVTLLRLDGGAFDFMETYNGDIKDEVASFVTAWGERLTGAEECEIEFS
jgi:hypothetical protein